MQGRRCVEARAAELGQQADNSEDRIDRMEIATLAIDERLRKVEREGYLIMWLVGLIATATIGLLFAILTKLIGL